MHPPNFWKNDPNQKGLWPVVLSPISRLWQKISDARWQKGPHFRMNVPVVCIGNVNLGGTGKTPTVIETVSRLIAMGHTPHVVSKGYKGQLTGPILVNPLEHTADDVGDEPLLLAAFASTWVAKNRKAGAQAAVNAGADVVVLDDGLQNPSLAKDLTILVADIQMGFGNGCVFPSGPLREPVEEAIEKSDVLLTIGPKGDAHKAFVENWPILKNLPHVSSTIEPLLTGMDWAGLPVLAFAGIGRPEKFYKTLKDMDVNIKATRSFDDHQKIPLTLLARLEKEAGELDAQLVTTEKDAARLPKEWQQKVITLPVRLKIHENGAFDEALKAIFS